MIYGVKHGHREIWQRWRGQVDGEMDVVGIGEMEEAGLIRFLGQKRKEGGVESNELVWGFLYIGQALEGL